MVGGMVIEGRLCCWPPRLVCVVPRLCVGVPFVVYPVALLNGGGWCVLCCPVFGLSLPLHVVLSLLHCLSFPLLSSSSPLHRLCSLLQCCWFSVVSL